METLFGGFILVVTEKNDFDYSNISIKLNLFVIKVLTVETMMEKSELLNFQKNYPPKNVKFSIATLMEQAKFLVLEN